MRRIGCLFTILLCFFCIQNVNGKTCKTVTEDDIKTFFAGDYPNEPYCTNMIPGCNGKKNLCTSGCYPLTIASVLASYGMNNSATSVSEYLCQNLKDNAQKTEYDKGITDNKEFHDNFKMTITPVEHSIATVDQILSEGKMILISIKSGTEFSSSESTGHYLAFALKKDDQYYVINTGKRDKNGWFDRSTIEKLVNNINAGMYSIFPSECTSFSSSGSTPSGSGSISGGTIVDPHPDNGFSDIDTGDESEPGCTNIFMKNKNELNEFGEFMQSLFTLIKIAAPTLVVILSTIDYIKAIANSSADETKKATNRTVKRVVIGILIFFLPFLLDILFHLFGLYDLSRCNIGG